MEKMCEFCCLPNALNSDTHTPNNLVHFMMLRTMHFCYELWFSLTNQNVLNTIPFINVGLIIGLPLFSGFHFHISHTIYKFIITFAQNCHPIEINLWSFYLHFFNEFPTFGVVIDQIFIFCHEEGFVHTSDSSIRIKTRCHKPVSGTRPFLQRSVFSNRPPLVWRFPSFLSPSA